MIDNEEILVTAAKAAIAILPTLEAEHARLSDEISKIVDRIGKLQKVVQAVDLPSSESTPKANLSIEDLLGPKAAKGSCMPDIDASLTAQATTVKDLQQAILKRAGIEYGISTLYANLQRGQKMGKYANENGRWAKLEKQ